MITQFSCKNFRNVNINELEIGRINLLLGPNNAGKSNFIKALSFGANMITMKNEAADSGFLAEVQRNGSFDILRKGALKPEIELKWRILLGQEKVDYKLKFHVGTSLDEFYIISEELDDANNYSSHNKPFNFFRCHDQNSGEGYFSTAKKLGERNARVKVPVRSDETVFRQFDKLVITNDNLNNTTYIRETLFSILEDMKGFLVDFIHVRHLCLIFLKYVNYVK